MGKIIILLSSSTSAVRLKDILEKKGFSSKIIQTPSSLSGGSCNYSVKTVTGALAEAEQLIKTVGFKSRGIYLDTEEEGAFRYRKLPPDRKGESL